MGLDMTLSKKTYIGAQYEYRGVKGIVDISIGDKKIPINFNKITYIEEEVAYWRKANAIHKWFVDNVQDGIDDCRDYYVSFNDLKTLYSLCKEVEKKAKFKKGKITNGYTFEGGEMIPILEDGEYIENADEIAQILPTSNGFFFGSTDYDEYYFDDIKKTIEILEEVIEEEKVNRLKGFSSEFYYRSSW